MKQELVQLTELVEAEFARNQARFGSRMQCRLGCTDCCHHRFDIDTTEARRIAAWLRSLPDGARQTLRVRAEAYQREAVLGRPARLKCAALDDSGGCAIYPARPLVCRMFGMPIYNPREPARLKACELNFRPGEAIDADGIVERQTEIHRQWDALKAKYSDGRRWTVAEALRMEPDAHS